MCIRGGARECLTLDVLWLQLKQIARSISHVSQIDVLYIDISLAEAVVGTLDQIDL